MIEPSAGTGSFYALLPAGSVGYDVEPKFPGIQTADFLTVEIKKRSQDRRHWQSAFREERQHGGSLF